MSLSLFLSHTKISLYRKGESWKAVKELPFKHNLFCKHNALLRNFYPASMATLSNLKAKLLKPPERECAICMDSFPVSEFRKPSSKCEHEPSTCDKCNRNHIKEEVNGKGITRVILCPIGTCKKALDHQEIKVICTGSEEGRRTFARFDDLLCRRSLEAMSDFIWCTGQNCGSGQLHMGADETPVVECGKGTGRGCGAKTCFIHKIPWHEGLTCDQYSDRLEHSDADKKAAEWKARMTKPCPKCEAPIEKDGGCCHMTCTNAAADCKFEFCWHCNAPWVSGMLGRRGAHHHARNCCRYMPEEK